jgi:HEAT repeat protein
MEDEPLPNEKESLAALGNDDWRVRRRAVEQLVERRTAPEELQSLLNVLRDSHRDFARLNGAIQVLVQTGIDVVPALIELLAEPDAELRCYVALTLGERGDPRAVPALVNALSDPDANLCAHAAEALGRLRSVTAVEVLLKIVESRDFAPAFAALNALGAIGDERVWRTLLPYLYDPFLQSAAIEALGRLGDRHAIAPFIELVAQVDAPVAAVVSALVQLHDREAVRYHAGPPIADEIQRLLGRVEIDAVLTALPQASSAELPAFVRLLGWISDRRVAAVLVPWMARPELRELVAQSLAAQGAAAVPLLIALLPETDSETQWAVCELLGRLGDVAAAPALTELFTVEEADVAVAAIEAVATLGARGSFDALLPLLGHANKSVRHAAVLALAASGHPATLTEMLPRLGDDSPQVREAAVKIIGLVDGPAMLDQILLRCSDSDERVRRAAVEQLPAVADDRLLPLLDHLMQTDCPAVRAAAVGALAKREVEEVRGRLLQALEDPHPWVRYAALQSLTQHDSSAMSIERLEQLASVPNDVPVRAAALAALGERQAAYSTLAKHAEDLEPDIARAGIAALGRGRFPQATALLGNLLNSGDARLRIEAVQALAVSGLPETVEWLRTAAGAKDRSTATAALAGLAALKSSQSVAAFLDRARNPTFRVDCIAAFADASDALIPLLAQGLHHADVDVRRTVVEVLRRRPWDQVREPLQIALADSHPAVRYAAQSALDLIALSRADDLSVSGREGDR